MVSFQVLSLILISISQNNIMSNVIFQLRRESRLRREFIYRKGVEERNKSIHDKKERLKRAIDGNL